MIITVVERSSRVESYSLKYFKYLPHYWNMNQGLKSNIQNDATWNAIAALVDKDQLEGMMMKLKDTKNK